MRKELIDRCLKWKTILKNLKHLKQRMKNSRTFSAPCFQKSLDIISSVVNQVRKILVDCLIEFSSAQHMVWTAGNVTRSTANIARQDGKMKTITLQIRDEDVYQVIVDELKDVYISEAQFADTVLEPEYELLKAIQNVLAYYMTEEELELWNNKEIRN
jgi:hypothetical protein